VPDAGGAQPPVRPALPGPVAVLRARAAAHRAHHRAGAPAPRGACGCAVACRRQGGCICWWQRRLVFLGVAPLPDRAGLEAVCMHAQQDVQFRALMHHTCATEEARLQPCARGAHVYWRTQVHYLMARTHTRATGHG